MDVNALVEPDRVHKTVYTDQQIFDRGDGATSGRGSGSTAATSRRCRTAGDYYAVTIGRQPMIMVRQRRRQRAGAATTAARTAACRSSAT